MALYANRYDGSFIRYLLRQDMQVDGLIAPCTIGGEQAQGQPRLWMIGNGGYFSTSTHDGITRSQENSGGSVLGATYRMHRRV